MCEFMTCGILFSNKRIGLSTHKQHRWVSDAFGVKEAHKVIHFVKIKTKASWGGGHRTWKVWLTRTPDQMEPGIRDRLWVPSLLCVLRKATNWKCNEPLTLAQFLPRTFPMDSPGNDHATEVTQSHFEFPKCGVYMYKPHCGHSPTVC